jgi:hypothetical protein
MNKIDIYASEDCICNRLLARQFAELKWPPSDISFCNCLQQTVANSIEPKTNQTDAQSNQKNCRAAVTLRCSRRKD